MQLKDFVTTTNRDYDLEAVLATMAQVSKATSFFEQNSRLEISEQALLQSRCVASSTTGLSSHQGDTKCAKRMRM